MDRKPASILVIAILGIVTSGFNLLFTPCGLFMLFRPFVPNPIVDGMAKDHVYVAITVSSYVVNFLLSLALMGLSIASLKLIPWARRGMMIYAGIAIAWVSVCTIVSFAYVIPTMAHLAAKTPASRYAVIGGVAGGLIGLCYAVALPIAILICFRRVNVVNAFNGIFPAPHVNVPIDYPSHFPPA